MKRLTAVPMVNRFLVETVTAIHAVRLVKTSTRSLEGLFCFIRTGFKASTTSNISGNIGNFLTNFPAY